MDLAIVAARFVQFASTLVLFGSSLFLLYGVPRDIARHAWTGRLLLWASFVSLMSTVALLDFTVVDLSGDWGSASDAPFVWSVMTGTQFGHAFLVRLIVALLAFLVSAAQKRLRFAVLLRIQLTLGAVLVASFAWTGHGGAGEGVQGVAHRLADIVHLAAAGVWMGALICLSVMLWHKRREPGVAGDALARFSGIGSIVVAALLLSGLVNSWFLLGLRLSALLTTAYGRVLAVKLVLFGGMVGLAALNRYVLTPSLRQAATAGGPDVAMRPLRKSLVAETSLGLLVLLAVAYLGTLAPPVSGG